MEPHLDGFFYQTIHVDLSQRNVCRTHSGEMATETQMLNTPYI